MVVFYENSKGERLDLLKPPYRTVEADWYNAQWSDDDSSYEMTISIDVFGNKEDFRNNMEILYRVIAVDSETGNYGRLYVNDTFLRCRIKSSKKTGWKGFIYSVVDLTFEAPELIWVEEVSREFYPQQDAVAVEGLDFEFDYDFDFADPEKGSAAWEIDHIISNEFQMIIYGPCVNPSVFINDWTYEVNTSLASGEYLIIDSLSGTVMKYKTNGSIENLFNNRGYEHSVFEKIPSGLLQINWSGDFGFDLYLFLQRREAKW